MQFGYGGAALVAGSAVLLLLTIFVLAKNPGATTEVACCPGHFLHGVASGEPHHNGIVLWTRLTPKASHNASEPVKVYWEVWRETDGTVADPIVKGEASARPDRDFTIKVDIKSDHLKPQVQYTFQFSAGSEKSPVGRFRLPPAGGERLDSLKYAVFSCSNWRFGYFNAYGAAARENLDFWLHVGDYIYESGKDHDVGKYSKEVIESRNKSHPDHETLSLDDYRKRHALYRTDPDLQKLASAAPLVSIWDDHEVANNAWKRGAGAHSDKKEGDYGARRAAALRAYHEWMPTRPQAQPWSDGAMHKDPWMQWRRLDFGDLASLLVLETRHVARTQSDAMTRDKVADRIGDLLKSAGHPPPDKWPGSKLEKDLEALRAEVEVEMNREDKTILGKDQLAWIQKQVHDTTKSGVKWRLVAQPLVVQPRTSPNYEEAIKKAHAAGSADLAEEWRRVLKKINSMPDSARKRNAMNALAAGRYKINLSFDDWMGFVADRGRFMAALDAGRPSSTLVYGGDTHNGWAGTLREPSGKAVATEFAGMSVSSPGLEFYNPDFPPKLEAAAWQAVNSDLAWVDTQHRGFMLVTLGRDSQHVEYRGVDVKSPGNSESKCLSAFGVARGTTGPRHRDCHQRKEAASLTQAEFAGPPKHRHGQVALRRGPRGVSSLSLSP